MWSGRLTLQHLELELLVPVILLTGLYCHLQALGVTDTGGVIVTSATGLLKLGGISHLGN